MLCVLPLLGFWQETCLSQYNSNKLPTLYKATCAWLCVRHLAAWVIGRDDIKIKRYTKEYTWFALCTAPVCEIYKDIIA